MAAKGARGDLGYTFDAGVEWPDAPLSLIVGSPVPRRMADLGPLTMMLAACERVTR